MPSIAIRNFGPIKEGFTEDDGFIDINKCNVFIGKQGSGKSTVAKVISTMTWLEKALNNGDEEMGNTTAWLQGFFTYQGVQNYFRDETYIEYRGEAFTIKYAPNDPSRIIARKSEGDYHVPKIMYVPAERNFLSVVENAFELNGLPPALLSFGREVKNAQRQLGDGAIALPKGLGGVMFYHNQSMDQSFLIGTDYEVVLSESSSGFQSFVPLYLVSRYLGQSVLKGSKRRQGSIMQAIRESDEIAAVMSNESFSENEKIARVKSIQSRYVETYFFNIVEEPEQNLYPSSQRAILNYLLALNDSVSTNKLVITTHSPYIINYLTLAIKADSVLRKIVESKKEDLLPRLEDVVPQPAATAASDVSIYELEDGKISKLANYNGLPSDENYLNEKLAESNDLFAQLLEIQQAI